MNTKIYNTTHKSHNIDESGELGA